MTIPRAQQEKYECESLQKNADEHGAIRDRQQSFVFPERGHQIKHQRRDHRSENQQHQPAKIWNRNEETNAAGDKNFLFVFEIPSDNVESSPALEAGKDRGVN